MLFNEPKLLKSIRAAAAIAGAGGFSALQRAEIAEIQHRRRRAVDPRRVSVLFNEPKLLKFNYLRAVKYAPDGFSALQRAEIAEIKARLIIFADADVFQCSSTSRNC